MSCAICGSDYCCPTKHSVEEQKRFAELIELKYKISELEQKLRRELEKEKGQERLL